MKKKKRRPYVGIRRGTYSSRAVKKVPPLVIEARSGYRVIDENGRECDSFQLARRYMRGIVGM